jgi:four helix bundle suffix protein
MVQAARSGMMNIAEGNKQKSLATYIKLTGVARGSLEELLKDYLSFARQRNLKVWSKERSIREIGEIREIWEILRRTPTIPDHPDFPDLPHNSEKAVNLMVTLIHQANYLLDRLVVSLEVKHAQEGGFSENMLKTRLDNRRRSK